jgi:hypothetical protein
LQENAREEPGCGGHMGMDFGVVGIRVELWWDLAVVLEEVELGGDGLVAGVQVEDMCLGMSLWRAREGIIIGATLWAEDRMLVAMLSRGNHLGDTLARDCLDALAFEARRGCCLRGDA